MVVALCLGVMSPGSSKAGTATPFAPPAGESRVLYQHATLIDGTGGAARPDMSVLVAGERIERVMPSNEDVGELARGAKVVELRGRYLMPGLIDSHIHLATPPNRRQAEALIRRNIYGGVTAVRDMADDLRALADIARASRVGEIAGSDVYYAALMAGPGFFTDKRTIQVTAGGVPGQVPWMQAITNDTDLPLAVAMARGTYATGIKLYADLTADLAGKIIAEAHRQHIPVWAHATLFPAKPSELVAAGVDSISHACLLTREVQEEVPRWPVPPGSVPPLDQFRGGDNPALARLFAEMVRHGTIFDATVWAYAPENLPASAPASSQRRCDEPIGAIITGQAYRAGVAISAGTDNIAPERDAWPDLFHELADLSGRAGMPMSAVLSSATLIGARVAGQEHDMGSIEAGKLANMVVTSRDPLGGVDNLRSVVMTIKRGRIYRREAFKPLRKGDLTDF